MVAHSEVLLRWIGNWLRAGQGLSRDTHQWMGPEAGCAPFQALVSHSGKWAQSAPLTWSCCVGLVRYSAWHTVGAQVVLAAIKLNALSYKHPTFHPQAFAWAMPPFWSFLSP